MQKQISCNWNYSQLESNKVYILPPGSYFIGDLFYVIGDSLIKNIFDMTACDTGYYKSDYGCFLVGETESSSSQYYGTDGKKYLVDNGIIGIISANLISDPDTSGGHIYKFENEVAVRINSGVFKFNSYIDNNNFFYLMINTVSKDERDSE